MVKLLDIVENCWVDPYVGKKYPAQLTKKELDDLLWAVREEFGFVNLGGDVCGVFPATHQLDYSIPNTYGMVKLYKTNRVSYFSY